MYEFSVYGIAFQHDDDWLIHVDPIKSFEPSRGSVKAEVLNRENQTAEASMRVAWDQAPEGIASFAENYYDQLDDQYRKTIKNTNRYKILSKELLEHHGHLACVSHAALNSSTHFIRVIGRNVDLEIIELALHCRETNRIIIATISATMEYFEAHEESLRRMLFSLRCHNNTGESNEI